MVPFNEDLAKQFNDQLGTVADVIAGKRPAKPNAQLIAAAPEMFEALQLCIGSLPSDTDDLTREVFRRVRAVVAKAEGR